MGGDPASAGIRYSDRTARRSAAQARQGQCGELTRRYEAMLVISRRPPDTVRRYPEAARKVAFSRTLKDRRQGQHHDRGRDTAKEIGKLRRGGDGTSWSAAASALAAAHAARL